MKFKLTDLSGFSDIGTVVYYKERQFYPENSNPTYLLEDGYSLGYLYSTSEVSEYIDFGKTGFSFLGDNKEELIPNLYDYSDSLEISETPKDLDKLMRASFPSLSQTRVSEELNKHFFGRLTSPDKVSHLIHLPKDVWKVEVYNSRILGNCNLGFIDYDILSEINLEELNITLIESPVLTIYFGPGYDTRIQDFTLEELKESGFNLYLDRYHSLEKNEYHGFTKILTKTEYIENYREEIKSEKLLYIVNTPEGKISDINFYSLAYPESKIPHPHLSETVLRNDYLWNSHLSVTEDFSSEGVIDSRSGVLLGIKSLSISESSWFHGANPGYSKSSVSPVSKVNGKTWIKTGESLLIGENPEISPWWYSPEDLPESEFRYFYVVNKGKGSVIPGGLIYLGPGKPLKLKVIPDVGYEYSGISNVFGKDIKLEENGDITVETSEYDKGYRFEVIFKEILYSLNLQLDCVRDYPGNNGFKTTYNLLETGLTGGLNFTPLFRTQVRLIYLNEDGEEVDYESPLSRYNRMNPLTLSDSRDLYFRLDFSGTNYELDGDLRYGDGRILRKSGDWYVLKVSDYQTSNSRFIIPVGNLVSKKYMVTFKATSSVQISTPRKNILEYHNMDPASLSPSPRPFISRMILKPGNIIEVRRNGELVSDGGGEWELIKEGNNIWSFRIPYIQNNYEIIIK